MARKAGVNMSEQIRQVLNANPGMKTKEVVSTLAEKGIKVQAGLVYYIKGKDQGRQSRKKKANKLIAKVAAATGPEDALSTIRKVKHLAAEVGGLKKLKALVEALGE